MCSHLQTEDGFCINCGIQITTLNLVDSYTPVNHHTKSQKHIYLLNKLLHTFNISEFKPNILHEYNTKAFSFRHSMKDKLLLCTYKVLRDSSYPITFSDVEKYSPKIKSKWFKEYKYIPYSKAYIRNLLDRFGQNISCTNLQEVMSYVEKYSNKPMEKVIQKFLINKKSV
ncbi:uncharacterized protein VNE69_10093 [Vairimorpha necatrix]|uniref:Uncharacterized protein n=1 Tax=Vairimorpha necatrix TaxID=6039 RepID=A0AAX4JFH6_9MICR